MQTMQHAFQGIWLPLVTPFLGDAVDHAALANMVARYRASGLSGLVVCGSTGEAAALDEAEQLAVLDTVLGAAGDMPVTMGLAGNHLGNVLARLDRLGNFPLAGVLAPAPYYIRPSQAGLLDYFRRLADASRARLVLYDIPYRTGATLTLDTLLQLADHDNIVAIKDCGGNVQTTQALIDDGRLAVLAGEDLQMLNTLERGGQGAIIASAHVRPELFVAIWRAMREGRIDEAHRLFDALVPLMQALFAEPNPGPVKALLAQQGWLRNSLRAPMTAASFPLAAQLAALHEGLDVVFA
ncbi:MULTISPECIES: 4-hydroxy-tetrahydrodipicolinate synthase [unclassified Cupriavidus]|uniref:4-hydroxy-tetrahydrodipicolinate synthase n=1 Tax=unclassified Cupriavidus TaxID=2640874 RepID=UPI001365E44F|nr:4-hydroxy-tetrahydrodipicolinate synthase [Cupriavidus sp. SW-Y-13]MWL86454.1 4-hydroxy-tetrahydrodipicolinate synthase [Cupriavidus sp. SW-Y-13]